MATAQLAPARDFAELRAESDRAYWQWRKRSARVRLLASGVVSWLIHIAITLVLLWGGESLVPRRPEPPRVDVVAAVGEAMGAFGQGDDGIAPGEPRDLASQPPGGKSSDAPQRFIPDSVPGLVADYLPKVDELKLPSVELGGSLLSTGNGLMEGSSAGDESGGGGRGGSGGAGLSGLGVGWANTDFVGISGSGSRFVYVLDRSASMAHHDRLAAVKRELLASVKRLPPESQFQVIFYNLRPDVMPVGGKSQRLLFATDPNKNLAARYLEGIFPDGGTEHVPALKAALKLGADVIFFLTDADDLRAYDVKEVTELNRGRAAIHAIEFAVGPRPDRENMLELLALQNGGTYRYLDVGRIELGQPGR
jgi:hypothetical protein